MKLNSLFTQKNFHVGSWFNACRHCPTLGANDHIFECIDIESVSDAKTNNHYFFSIRIIFRILNNSFERIARCVPYERLIAPRRATILRPPCPALIPGFIYFWQRNTILSHGFGCCLPSVITLPRYSGYLFIYLATPYEGDLTFNATRLVVGSVWCAYLFNLILSNFNWCFECIISHQHGADIMSLYLFLICESSNFSYRKCLPFF